MKILVLSDLFILREAISGFFAREYKDYKVVQVKNLDELKDVDFEEINLVFADGNLDFTKKLLSIKEKHTNIKIIIIDRYKKEEVFDIILKNRIDAYISDILEKEDLIYAVNRVFRNMRYYDTELLGEIIKNRENEREEYVNLLTEREIEILKVVKRGYTNKEIANKLHITEHTVKKHIANILEKLDMKNRKDIILFNKMDGKTVYKNTYM